MAADSSFDRVRPRHVGPQKPVSLVDGEIRVPDREGKRALFSEEPVPPAFGAVALSCGLCETRSVVGWSRALRLALPSIPALVPGSGVRVYMKCPTCGRRTWVEMSVRT